MAPKTSVIIPVHNGAQLLLQAIVSVLGQLDEGDELLVIDDASTDDTPSILADIADPRLHRLVGKGQGVSAARNLGLAAAQGELVGFLDHDDLWPAERHRNLLAALRQHEASDAVFGRVRLRLDSGARNMTEELKIDGRHACWLVGSALYRRSLLDRCGGFAEDMQVGQDVDFYLRLTEMGMRSQLCDADALVYRLHDANRTNDRAKVRRAHFAFIRRKLARARKGALPGSKPAAGQ